MAGGAAALFGILSAAGRADVAKNTLDESILVSIRHNIDEAELMGS
jgi:hypothetical protein